MDASFISALAALVGAAIGGLTSVFSSWLTQKNQARVLWLAQDKIHRQDLYKEFIEVAAKCHADALQNEQPEISTLVELYAKIGRMRVLSSPPVVVSAEQVGRKIVDTYLEPNKTFHELREMVASDALDILGAFSEACREELESIRAEQF
jgi:hypothetical protein